MTAIENPVLYQLPVLEETISPSEIHEFLSQPTTHPISGLETSRSVYSTEERRLRRMISNRESARRSRWRKKKRQEDLASEADRLRLENRELENRLSALANQCHVVQRDSNRLLSESVFLQHRLAGLHEILAPTMLLQ
ncbi:hypothetical protein AAHA92_30435 [Salvia divinorum]|uniref:BZIP domain-containing protein n=1 Tax=Salvia divinorum TaxID=28513 RepID=A0ABD1FU25_SALDI